MNALGKFLAAVLALAALYLILGESTVLMGDHDEDQFIATGLLTAEKGLLPYRDYPLFHTPYCVILTGWLAHWTGQPFLIGRMLPAVCAWLMLLLIAGQSWRWLADFPVRIRAGGVLALSVLLLFSHVFYYTIGHAWNHQMPTLFVLIAMLLLLRAAEKISARAWFFLTGICLGLAIGMRLSFLPLLAPFGLATFLLPGWAWREKRRAAILFSVGVLVALAPLLWLTALAPEQAYFSNFTYPKLALMWRKYPFWGEHVADFVDPVRGYFGHTEQDFQGRSLWRKLQACATGTLRPNWPLYATWLLLGFGPPIAALWRSRGRDFAALLLVLALPFFIWGSSAPSRVHPQYWYAPLPVLALGVAFGMAQLRSRAALVLGLLAITATAAVMLTARDYTPALKMTGPTWPPHQTQALVKGLAKTIDHGPVLTMESALATMAGLEIYPAFASGEFGWRSAHLLPAEKRRMLHLICPYDLETALAAQPPAAVFLRKDQADRNGPLIAWAQRHGYTAQPFGGVFEIWRPAKTLP